MTLVPTDSHKLNFVPKCDEKARQKFPFNTIRKSLNQDFYKPLHTPSFKSLSDCLEDKKTKPESTSINTMVNENNDNPTFEKQNALFDELDRAWLDKVARLDTVTRT